MSSTTRVKTVDLYWNAEEKAWKHKNTTSDIPAELVQPVGRGASSDAWKEFCFVVLRRLPDPRDPHEQTIDFKVVVTSPHLLNVCRDIIGQVPGLSWNSQPVKVSMLCSVSKSFSLTAMIYQLDPLLLISFFPQLEKHAEKLQAATRNDDEEQMLSALSTLIKWLRANYGSTLANIANLTAHGEITFDLLYAVLVPRTILVTRDDATGEPRCLRLLSARREKGWRDDERYILTCEGVEAADPKKDAEMRRNSKDDIDHNSDDDDDQTASVRPVGRAFGTHTTKISIRMFGGTQKINRLSAYPISYHADPEGLKATLIKRGRKWASLNGVHHVYYRGLAGKEGHQSYIRYNVSHSCSTVRYDLRWAP